MFISLYIFLLWNINFQKKFKYSVIFSSSFITAVFEWNYLSTLFDLTFQCWILNPMVFSVALTYHLALSNFEENPDSAVLPNFVLTFF